MAVKARLRRTVLVAFLLASPPAQATATLSCEANDANLDFSLLASVNRDYGTIVGVTGGNLILKPPKLAKLGKEFAIQQSHIVQQWSHDKELRVGINVEPDDGSIFLAVIATAINDDGSYKGNYVLTVSQRGEGTTKLTGSVDCSSG